MVKVALLSKLQAAFIIHNQWTIKFYAAIRTLCSITALINYVKNANNYDVIACFIISPYEIGPWRIYVIE